eukprot:CAMPEP_0170061820 /NCGR_PEP_ID=MMETSP0019_2-20121128/3254_1 /TAXON_ID=98059 /ORGANISM="Dinobryon sp., Strain UTEXLB2267" /LENGTH=405 /DNA_ID=CAMNT_0010267765 /DNA_START=914 /DNA_END=2131 /DNA_ORIENTATION=-
MQELKEAYRSISFRNHPDRNKSVEALNIFRNASYAYKVLGKDRKTRLNYDSEYSSGKSYLDVLEAVSNDVIGPLAMGVAVPLINLTMQSISAFAFPFIRDAVEQSNVVFKSAFQKSSVEGIVPNSTDIDPEFAHLDFLLRTSSALQKKQYEQSLRSLKENIEKSIRQQESLQSQLQESLNLEQYLLRTVQEQQIKGDQLTAQIRVYERETSLTEKKFMDSDTIFDDLKFEYEVELNKTSALQIRLDETILSTTNVELRIAELEELLKEAKVKLRALNSDRINIQNEIYARKNRRADIHNTLVAASNNRKEKKAQLSMAKDVLSSARSELLNLSNEKKSNEVLAQRQGEYRSLLEKKYRRTISTIETLKEKLIALEMKWKQSEKEFLEMVQRKEKEDKSMTENNVQ